MTISLVPIRPNFLDKQTLTNYWDTNVYEATCTHVAPRLAGPYLGLAEYTNANFLSTDTIFTEDSACTNGYYFPHPRRDETDYNPLQLPEELSRAEDGVTDRVHYIHITDPPEGLGVGEVATRTVAAMRYLKRYSSTQLWPYYVSEFYTDDDEVHKATAGRLLPRAVGYSASLLDYFFRGRFEAKDENTPLVETLSPASIRLNFKNASGEAFVNGTIYLYQDSGEEGEIGKDNLLEAIAVAPGVILDDGAAFVGQEFKNITVTVPAGKSITDLVFTLLYVGRLGWEENAVVAKRFKAPPPPADLGRQVYAVGNNPMGITVTPDGARVLVTNYSDNTVSVLDARGTEVTDTIAVGDGPYDVAVASHYAFVSNERAASISVIDVDTRRVVKTFDQIQSNPRGLAVSPDGSQVYCAHWANRPWRLSRIDVASLTLLPIEDVTNVPMAFQDVALHPREPQLYALYYAYWWRYALAVFNTNTDTKILDVLGPTPTLSRSGAVESGGNSLYYLTRYLDQVSVLDTPSNTHAAAIPLPAQSNAMRASAGSDGKVYVTLYGMGQIAAIDGAGRKLIGKPYSDTEIAGPTDIAVSPDNRYLYVSSTDNAKVLRLPNPFLDGAAPAPVAANALLALTQTPTFTATGYFPGLPDEAEIWVDGRYPLHEGYQDGQHLAFEISPGLHQVEIVSPGYARWSQALSFAEGDNTFTPQMIQEP